LIIASHDMVISELKDHGFPYATARIVERPGSTPDRVQLAVEADSGPTAVFGVITVDGNVSVGDDVIRRS
jgi:hypothetical protein